MYLSPFLISIRLNFQKQPWLCPCLPVPAMCTTRECDLEEIPLDDDDPNSLEFKILEFYVKQHVFKNNSAVFSPERLRTRSLSQKGLGSCSTNESGTQVSWAWRNSQPSEKPIILAKKKSSWRTFFGVVEKEEDSLRSSTEIHRRGQRTVHLEGGRQRQSGSRSLSTVERCLKHEAVDPKVVCIANRVAEIVNSWPPPEELLYQEGSFQSEERLVVYQGPQPQILQLRAASSKKDDDNQIIARIVDLLKYSGDHLEKELKRDKTLMNTFQDRLSYSVFKTITDHFLRGVDTRGESEVRAQGFKAALAIDVTAKLTAVDNHPMNRVLGFGTKYLRDNFSPWVQQHGGWEKVLGISCEEVD
ncbi:apoptosis facilitator Bcl-2-like protein 14 isoform X1 [Manis javanica]|uniref:apoptosis facilitator Bcl-2-like protein 14 isoform X1 n=2 Tax=Manis javanica TaxID=9974 RepID=UPI003C6D4673